MANQITIFSPIICAGWKRKERPSFNLQIFMFQGLGSLYTIYQNQWKKKNFKNFALKRLPHELQNKNPWFDRFGLSRNEGNLFDITNVFPPNLNLKV